MDLFYDDRDDKYHEARGSQILYWLDDLGGKPLAEARPHDQGFLFAGARPIDDYRELVERLPFVRDRPDEREPLLRLDTVLDTLQAASVRVPTPTTWRLELDAPLPADLTFPLFVRTAESSWKVGGRIARVRSPAELESEAALLRRALGWNALVMARTWHDFAEAGESAHGPIPQEVRVWIVDQRPYAWSFHYLNVVKVPRGFPLKPADIRTLAEMGRAVGCAFRSRLTVADFARQKNGEWLFIEAGPGSCAGTAHETVFKSVASRLRGEELPLRSDSFGGGFEDVD
jgi:hypothetical protein